MSSRSYLSIGDVLTLLREEFPDVTISKIRFLESQGLVNPERSPSGYRKFFEHDVERLRWVLRQQREHFLPLKVIRDRLAEGGVPEDDLTDMEISAEPVEGAARRNGKVPQPQAARAAARPAGLAGAGPAAGRTEEQSARADDEAMARILADASRRSAMMPEAGATRPPLRVVGEHSGGAVPAGAPDPTGPAGSPEPKITSGVARASALEAAAAAAAGSSAKNEQDLAPTGKVAGRRSTDPEGPVPTITPGPTADGPTAATPPEVKAKPPTPAPAPAPVPAAAPLTTSGTVTGASLTAEELCRASGLSEIELASLQGFGLIEARDTAGIVTFDEDALTVANLVVEFRAYGIEPRHLRLYRNAVDREIGLIEQVIIPLLRQRNPESRQRAVDGAENLGALGQSMRAALLRSALRRHIGG